MDTEALIADFLQVAGLAGVALSREMIEVEELPAPHAPPSSLPQGRMAAYVFLWGDVCLKVGKVGPKSQARYTSHHYSPGSSRSNLAKSILGDSEIRRPAGLDCDSVGSWIRANTDRLDFLLPKSAGPHALSLLEAFLQCRLRPRYEGPDAG